MNLFKINVTKKDILIELDEFAEALDVFLRDNNPCGISNRIVSIYDLLKNYPESEWDNELEEAWQQFINHCQIMNQKMDDNYQQAKEFWAQLGVYLS